MGFARAQPILQGEPSGQAAGDADDGFRKSSTQSYELARLRGASLGGVVACGPDAARMLPNEPGCGSPAAPRGGNLDAWDTFESGATPGRALRGAGRRLCVRRRPI